MQRPGMLFKVLPLGLAFVGVLRSLRCEVVATDVPPLCVETVFQVAYDANCSQNCSQTKHEKADSQVRGNSRDNEKSRYKPAS